MKIIAKPKVIEQLAYGPDLNCTMCNSNLCWPD